MIKAGTLKKLLRKIMCLNNEKESIEKCNKKTTHLLPEKQRQKSNENGNMDTPKVIKTSIVKEHPNDLSLPDIGNTLIQHQCHNAKNKEGPD